MLTYILRRLLGMIPVLIFVSIITFIIIQLPPGDFFTTLQAEVAATGGGQNKETIEKLQEIYGLDQPLYNLSALRLVEIDLYAELIAIEDIQSTMHGWGLPARDRPLIISKDVGVFPLLYFDNLCSHEPQRQCGCRTGDPLGEIHHPYSI